MKMYALSALAIASLLVVTRVYADGGCPPGQYPQQGQGWQTCVPIPGYSEGPNQIPPPPAWHSQWQAVAVDLDNAVLGKAVDRPDMHDAEALALDDCRSQGGTTCKVAISYGNGCVALAAGDVLVATGSGGSKSEAEGRASDKCSAGAKNCHVYYSACSFPKRAQ